MGTPSASGGGPRLVPVDFDPFAEGAPGAGTKPGTLVLSPLPGESRGDPSMASQAAGIAKSFASGLVEGAIATPSIAADIGQIGMRKAVQAGDRLRRAVGLAPNDPRAIAELDQPMPGTTAFNRDLFERYVTPLHKPEGVAEEYARTIGEFAPGAVGGPGRALSKVAGVVLPALASETAGQVTKGTAAEPWARAGAGLVGGAAHAYATLPSAAERLASRSLAEMEPAARGAALGHAQQLLDEARDMGIPLSTANAIDTASGGVTNLSGLQRHVEATGRMRPFYASVTPSVDRAVRLALDRFGPRAAQPAVLGGEVQQAARAGVAQTPEGMALAAAREAAGPRVTPEQAGQVIQPEMRRTFEGRDGMRAALGEQDYAAARAAPDRVGIDRMVTVERPGEPVLQTLDPGPRPAPSFGADAPPQLADLAPTRAFGTGEPAPVSLARFIASRGGIGLERGDARAAGLTGYAVPGVGRVAHEGGRSIDDLRPALVEAGYFPPGADGYATRSLHDDVLSALQEERAGRPLYRPADATAVEQRAGAGSAVQDEFQAAASQATSSVREALRGAGVDSARADAAFIDRAAATLVRGDVTDPLQAYEQAVMSSRQPPARPTAREVPTTVTEQIPAPVFGQVNPQPVVDHIDGLLRSAKGPAAKALASARRTLFTPDGKGLDLSVDGLHNAREAIGDLIAKAEPAAQRTLLGVREKLDGALSTAPEYERARSGFEAASRAVDPFADGTVPGRIVAHDPRTGRPTMPPERVPVAIDEGSTGARSFADLASPEARQAYEGHLRTRFLDDATDATTGEVSAGRLREALRANEDGLRPFPETRQHLERIAFAREGREAVDRSPLGRIAQRPDARGAIDALFPAKAVDVSPEEVTQAVRGLVRNSPLAARSLIRMHAESVFNDAMAPLKSGPSEAAGAKFVAALRGSGQQAANLDAALRALPRGDLIADGFGRLLDVLEATGKRQDVGARSAYNARDLAELSKGGAGEAVGKMVLTGGLKLPSKVLSTLEEWRQGRNLDQLASLFASPDAASTFRGLLESRNPATHLANLTMIAMRGANSGETAKKP